MSDTIEIAALDRWYSLKEKNAAADPEQFSRLFADEYFSNNSQVDVWNEQSLAAAKKHIEQCRIQGH